MLQKRLSLAIDEGLMDLQEIDWAEQHRLLASEFGETGGRELDGLPALQDRFDQPRARSSRSDRAAPAPSVPSPDAPPPPNGVTIRRELGPSGAFHLGTVARPFDACGESGYATFLNLRHAIPLCSGWLWT